MFDRYLNPAPLLLIRSKVVYQSGKAWCWINFKTLIKALAISTFVLTVFFLFFSFATYAATGINRTINFQGKLVNNPAKTNVSDTSYTVIFSIYNLSSGGTALWSETQTVTTADGIFRVALGSVTPFPANFNFNWDGLYLGMKVNSDSEMTPRIQLTAVPYAFNAEKVAGLTVQDDGGNASTSATLRLANGKTVTFSNTLSFSGTDAKSLTLTDSLISNTGALTLGGGNVLTLANNLTTAGNFALTLTSTATTNSTLPSGTHTLAAQDLAQSFSALQTFSKGVNISPPDGISPAATLSGKTSFANLIVDQSGLGDVFTASNSGTPRFTIQNTGNILVGTNNVFNTAGLLQSSALSGTYSNALTLSSASNAFTASSLSLGTNNLNLSGTAISTGGSNSIAINPGSGTLTSNATAINFGSAALTVASCSGCGGGSGVNFFGQTSGLLYPLNSTADFAVGAQATASAKFSVLNVGTGTPVASVSSGLSGTASYLTADGTFATANRLSLTIGNSATYNTTGNVLINPNGTGNVGIGTTTPGSKLEVSGDISIPQGNRFYLYPQFASSSIYRNSGNGNTAIAFPNTSATVFLANDSTEIMRINNGQVGINSSSPLGTLDVRGNSGTTPVASVSGQTSFAALVVDNKGLGDIFTASSSGLNRFVITQGGNVGIGTTNPLYRTQIQAASGNTGWLILANNDYNGVNTGTALVFDAGASSGNTYSRIQALNSGGSFGSLVLNSAGGNVGIGTTGPSTTLHVKPTTGNSLVRIEAVSGSQPGIQLLSNDAVNSPFVNFGISGTVGNVASIYGNAPDSSLRLSTGGSDRLTILSGGSVGIGTTAPLATLDVRGNSGTTPVSSISGQTSFAALVVDNKGLGDIFTASSSGLNRFVITQGGDVGIGTSNPTSGLLQLSSSTTSQNTSLYIDNSVNFSGNQTKYGVNFNSTAGTGTVTGAVESAYGGRNTINPGTSTLQSGSVLSLTGNSNLLTAGLGLTLSNTGTNSINVTGSENSITLSPTINQTSGTAGNITSYGSYNALQGTLTLTNVLSSTVNTYAGYFLNNLTSGGNANLTVNSYGLYSQLQNSLTTTGTTAKYAAYLDVSGSADNNYGLYINGVTNATNNFSIYSNSTADSYFAGKLGINSSSPIGSLDVRALSGTLSVASVSGKTSFANLVIDQSGLGDIFTASSAGKPLFTVLGTGNLLFGGGSPTISSNGSTNLALNPGSGTLTSNATSVNFSSAALTVSSCTGCGGGGVDSGLVLDSSTGVVRTENQTTDVLFGSTATSSAKFGFINVNSGTPTASISGTNGAIYMTANGVIGTTRKQTLQLGNSATGNVQLQANDTGSGNVQIGTGGTSTPDLLVLDTKNDNATDPTGTNGAMYYNSTAAKFRCFENSAWKDCDSGNSNKQFTAKSSNQSVTNSTTLASATNLSFTLGAGETWIYQAFIIASNNNSATPDWKSAIYAPNASVCDVNLSGTEPAGTAFVPSTANSTNCTTPNAVVNNNISASTLPYEVVMQGYVTDSGTGGTATVQFAENTAGSGTSNTIKAGSYIVAYKATGADLAEIYYSKEALHPGDVVTADSSLDAGVKKTTKAYDPHVMGIISTNPGMVLSDASPSNGAPSMVALSGRVPVNVSSENGTIEPGDLLTSSSVPGVGMKATKAGSIIGQALTGFSQGSSGTVLAFIKNGYWNGGTIAGYINSSTPSSQISGKDVLSYMLSEKDNAISPQSVSDITTDRVAAGLEVITPKITASDVSLDTLRAATGSDIALRLDSNGKFIIKNSSGSAAITFDSFGNANFAGNIRAKSIRADQIEGLSLMINDKLLMIKDSHPAATDSSTLNSDKLASIENQILGLSTQSAIPLYPPFATSGGGLVSGNLRVRGNGLFEGLLSVIDTLTTNNFIVNGLSTFLGDVVFQGRPTFNSDTAGFATVKKGDRYIEVKFDREYESEPAISANVYVPNMTDDLYKSYLDSKICDKLENQNQCQQKIEDIAFANSSFVISSKSTKGFKILLRSDATADVKFSWNAFSIKDAKIFDRSKKMTYGN